MGLFDDIGKGLKKFTPAGLLGLYDNNSVNYNDLFASQRAIYDQQIAERNRLANAADITNSNLASTTILTGGSKMSTANIGTAVSNDFSTRIASDAAVKGVSEVENPGAQALSTQGLSGDSLALQQQRNKKANDDFIKSLTANIDYLNIGGRQ